MFPSCLSSTVRLHWQNTPHTDAAFIGTVYFDCGMEKRIIVLFSDSSMLSNYVYTTSENVNSVERASCELI